MPGKGSSLRRIRRQEMVRDQITQQYHSQLDQLRKKALADGTSLHDFWDLWNRIINFEISIFSDATASEQQYQAEKALCRKFWPHEDFAAFHPSIGTFEIATGPIPKFLGDSGSDAFIPTGPRSTRVEDIKKITSVNSIPTGPGTTAPKPELSENPPLSSTTNSKVLEKNSSLLDSKESQVSNASSSPDSMKICRDLPNSDLYRPRYNGNSKKMEADCYRPETAASSRTVGSRKKEMETLEYVDELATNTLGFPSTSSAVKSAKWVEIPTPLSSFKTQAQGLLGSTLQASIINLKGGSSIPRLGLVQNTTKRIPISPAPLGANAVAKTSFEVPPSGDYLAKMKQKVIESQKRKHEEILSTTQAFSRSTTYQNTQDSVSTSYNAVESRHRPSLSASNSSQLPSSHRHGTCQGRSKSNYMEDIDRLIANRGFDVEKKVEETRIAYYSDEEEGEIREGNYSPRTHGPLLQEAESVESDEEEGELREPKRRKI